MTFIVSFKVDGNPVGKQRARYAKRGNFVQAYTPEKTRTYETLIKESAKQAMASVEFNDSARLAVYRLGDFGAEKITPDSLDRTALHELLHVFLHDLMMVATDPKSSDEDIEMHEFRPQ